jgi:hypothetical protein
MHPVKNLLLKGLGSLVSFALFCTHQVFCRRTLILMAAFSPVSITFLLTVPPLWNGYDGMVQIASKPGELTIIQYPFVYPLFSRIPIYAAGIVSSLLRGAWPHIHIMQTVILSDAGIYLLLAAQHLLLLLSLALFVKACTNSRLTAGLIVVLLASNASFFAAAHMVSTEGLSVSLTILLIALALKIFSLDKVHTHYLIAFGLCLYLDVLTRHVNAVFAALLPLSCLLGIVTQWRYDRQALLNYSKMFLTTIGLGLACLLMASWTTRLLCWTFNLQHRSIVGRAAIERLDFVTRLSDKEREALQTRLEAKTNDPIIKQAIVTLTQHKTQWPEAFEILDPEIGRRFPHPEKQGSNATKDRHLNEVCRLYYLSFHPQLLLEIKQSIWKAMLTTPSELAGNLLKSAEWSIDLYLKDGFYRKSVEGMSSCSANAKERIISFSHCNYLNLWSRASNLLQMIIALAGIALLWVTGTGDRRKLVFALSIAITGSLVAVMTFALVTYLARYTLPTCISTFTMLGTVAGAFKRRIREDKSQQV